MTDYVHGIDGNKLRVTFKHTMFPNIKNIKYILVLQFKSRLLIHSLPNQTCFTGAVI